MFARDKHSTAIECHLRLLEDVCGRILQSNVSFHRFVLFLEAWSHFIPYGAVQSGGKVFFFKKKKLNAFFFVRILIVEVSKKESSESFICLYQFNKYAPLKMFWSNCILYL